MKKKTQNKERINEMDKIYNNLSIENLIETEWFNQFNRNQQKEILKGLETNIDVSVYAKKDFSWEQMKKIKDFMKQGLDISIYMKSTNIV